MFLRQKDKQDKKRDYLYFTYLFVFWIKDKHSDDSLGGKGPKGYKCDNK